MIDPARSFEHVAADYEAARPSYPEEVLDVLPLERDATVLDLGAGTGKLTRVLVRRYRRVIAVEPLDGMRAILERVVPEAESLGGTAEQIPLPDESVDGVFAATAFHWFAHEAAIAEIARVLRPGGTFAVVWNDVVEPSPLPDAYRERLEEIFAEMPPPGGSSDEQFEVIGRGRFGELHETTVEHEQVQTRASTLAFVRSTSPLARRPPDERDELMAELGALLPEGEYVFRMKATMRWAERL